jgi:hypothetical protein
MRPARHEIVMPSPPAALALIGSFAAAAPGRAAQPDAASLVGAYFCQVGLDGGVVAERSFSIAQ